MKVSILGGGFGIYGYLPAFVQLGHEVQTLSKYKSFMFARPELKNFIEYVHFIEDEENLILNDDLLVIARKPIQQYNSVIQRSIPIKHIFLEKPLAPSKELHEKLVQFLSYRNQNFSVAYLFRFTPWFKSLKQDMMEPYRNVSINWYIQRIASDWKMDSSSGGGLLKFYAVHFLDVLYELGVSISMIKISEKTEDELTLKATSSLGNFIEINLIATNQSRFQIKISKMEDELLWERQNPFLEPRIEGFLDPRVKYLKTYIESTLLMNERQTAIERENFIIKGMELLTINQ